MGKYGGRRLTGKALSSSSLLILLSCGCPEYSVLPFTKILSKLKNPDYVYILKKKKGNLIMAVNNVTLEYDRDMSRSENFVPGQYFTLDDSTGAIYPPPYGCFFTESVRVWRLPERKLLRPGIDYDAIHFNIEGTTDTGKEVTTIIRMNGDGWHGKYEMQAHYIGGPYSTNPEIIAQLLADYAAQIRTVKWGDVVGKPFLFPAADHMVDVRIAATGWERMVQELESIRDAIFDGGLVTQERIYDYIDALGENVVRWIGEAIQEHDTAPKVHSSESIGLGNVSNNLTANIQDIQGLVKDRFLPAELIPDIMARGFSSSANLDDPASIMDKGVFVSNMRIYDVYDADLNYLVFNGAIVEGRISNDVERYQIAIGITPPGGSHPGNLGKMAVRARLAGPAASINFSDWVVAEGGNSGGGGGGSFPYIGVGNYLSRIEAPNGDMVIDARIGQTANTLAAGNDSRIMNAVSAANVDQSISGVKSFQSFPNIPTSDPVNGSHPLSLDYFTRTMVGILNQLEIDYVRVAGTQNISGSKNFTTLPTTSIAPTRGEHLVNLNYVNGIMSNLSGEVSNMVFNSLRGQAWNSPQEIGTTSLDELEEDGLYVQSYSKLALTINGYPENGVTIKLIQMEIPKTDVDFPDPEDEDENPIDQDDLPSRFMQLAYGHNGKLYVRTGLEKTIIVPPTDPEDDPYEDTVVEWGVWGTKAMVGEAVTGVVATSPLKAVENEARRVTLTLDEGSTIVNPIDLDRLNLDVLITAGNYKQTDASKTSSGGYPITEAGDLIVSVFGNSIYQVYVTKTGVEFKRTGTKSGDVVTWVAWVRSTSTLDEYRWYKLTFAHGVTLTNTYGKAIFVTASIRDLDITVSYISVGGGPVVRNHAYHPTGDRLSPSSVSVWVPPNGEFNAGNYAQNGEKDVGEVWVYR